MQVIPTEIPDVKILVPKKFGDHRGFFSETYNTKTFMDLGLPAIFVQDNHSMSAEPGVLRGLHYQLPPRAQAKLLRVTRGSILDVAVDIRRGSPTFGKHVSCVLSADNWKQLFVPVGFAHGFAVLEANTEVQYKVTDLYSPTHERGIRFNDPALGIDWHINTAAAILSDRDTKHPMLADATDLL